MEFPEKASLVKLVQSKLNVGVDGQAGNITWRAIRDNFGISSQYTLISSIIKEVQKLLGLVSDSIDGQKTWNGIVQKLGISTVKPVVEVGVVGTNKYPETIKLSPQTNGQYSQLITPKAIVMHDTCGNYAGSIDWTSRVINPDTGGRLYASYHCIIKRNGERTITNLDNNRAYHAGESFFKGKSSLNSWAIGVSFERDSNTEPLQKEAIESAIEYLIPRMKKWWITPDWVTDHRTIAPSRKVDLKKEEFEKFWNILNERWKSS